MGSLMHLLTAHAYVAVIYLRFFYSNGTVEVKLLTSKTHMAPIKGQITPQLELLDALILARTQFTLPWDHFFRMRGEYSIGLIHIPHYVGYET